MQDLMEQMDISDKTLYRLMDSGELPPFSYGSKTSRKKGWHAAVLERHAMGRYEQLTGKKHIRDAGQVRAEDMGIVPLRRSNRTVAKQNADLDDRDAAKQKLGRKVVAKGMRPSSSKSRVATGFVYSSG